MAARPYRMPGESGLVLVERKRRGLVRANGSVCTCRPPGRLWCWWFKVHPKDRWYCEHDGGWLRRSEYGTPYNFDHWEALLPESDEP